MKRIETPALDGLLKDIAMRRAQIVEDFTRVYLAAHMPDDPKAQKDFIASLELCECFSNDRMEVRWYFQVRKNIGEK